MPRIKIKKGRVQCIYKYYIVLENTEAQSQLRDCEEYICP